MPMVQEIPTCKGEGHEMPAAASFQQQEEVSIKSGFEAYIKPIIDFGIYLISLAFNTATGWSNQQRVRPQMWTQDGR